MSVYVTESVLFSPITLAVMEAILSKANAYAFQANNFLKELYNQPLGTSLHGQQQPAEAQTPPRG